MESTSNAKQLEIRLVTTDKAIAVADFTLAVPANIDPKGLQSLVKKLLEENDNVDDEAFKEKNFEFVVNEEFLRGPLDEFLEAKGGSSTHECGLEIAYIESASAPEPKSSANHDDWVAGVACLDNVVLTACYDNTVNLFDAESGAKRLTMPGHGGPVRAVAWIDANTFASCGHDQVVLLRRWNAETNAVEAVNSCKGHERSVECIAVSPNKKHIASGSFDATLKIWGTTLQTRDDDDIDGGETAKKKTKSDTPTRTPIVTLAGHKEAVSAVDWLDNGEIVTASWDHTIKIWSLEMEGMKSELVGNKSFFDLSYSPLNKGILTASADAAIRLYDARAESGGVLVKAQYTSHRGGWVTCVDWSRIKEELFISGGHDKCVKLWDSRSCKTPLYDLKGHEDNVLCCDWSQPEYVASGGSDSSMKIFKLNN